MVTLPQTWLKTPVKIGRAFFISGKISVRHVEEHRSTEPYQQQYIQYHDYKPDDNYDFVEEKELALILHRLVQHKKIVCLSKFLKLLCRIFEFQIVDD